MLACFPQGCGCRACRERLTFADRRLAKTLAPCMVDIYTKASTNGLTTEDTAKYKRPLIDNIIGRLSQVRN